jgi:4-hydroxy-tetrahydrodipicolinate synthase
VAKAFDLAKDKSRLRGIFPPILTPLTEDEKIDTGSMMSLADHLIKNGVHGIWVMGTTGEFASFDEFERAAAVEAAVEGVAGRVPVITNIGDCSTRMAVRHGKAAEKAGADAIALTPPYYYPNAQDELLAHFRKVKESVDLPLFVYNIPQTVKVKMDVATTLTLAKEGTIIGLKDSQNDLDWFRQVTVGARSAGLDLRCFLGTRFLIDAATVIGACGSIPSISNVAPRACSAAYEASERGDWAEAAKQQERVMQIERISRAAQGGGINAALFSAMKTILMKNGIIATNVLTSPLRQLTAAEIQKLDQIVAELEIGASA